MRLVCVQFFFFKQNTAYEMRISDWSSDVCSSDLFGSHGIGQGCKPVAFQQPGKSLIDPSDQSRPLIHKRGVKLHQAGARANTLIGVFGRADTPDADKRRSEERRVGKECVSTGRSRRAAYP